MRLTRTLTTLPLVFVMYFNISGGAFTTEGLVAEVGPGMALLILAIIPLLWSLPETLIVAELASMLPVEGGYYRWVGRAFGPFWAFQNGWLTWLYSLVDMAIYPVLFNAYLGFFFPGLSAAVRWGIALLVIWSSTAINLRGAFNVGRASVVAGAFVLTGFLALSLAALPHVAHVPWQPFLKPGETPLGALGIGAAIALWNYIGWDNASTVEGEIVDASRTYPRALAFTLPLVVLGYFVPLLASLGATDWTTWREGGWPDIARSAAGAFGEPIAIWLAVAGMVSALALFNSLLLAYSRVPLVVASDGLLPAALTRTDSRGTPRNAIVFSAGLYSIFTLVPFAGLVVADVLLYALALFLEFGALIALRMREPGLRGSFRIPLGTAGVVVLAALPAAVLAIVVALELQDVSYGLPAVLGALGAAAAGPVVYLVAVRYRGG
ncbi:MAG: APC family permease [Anaerolineae bacterium]|nr:APC family permease [Gemmatimonadaceae bacterium]